MGISDPENSHDNEPESPVVSGTFVIASRQAAELLAAVDQALDPVALTIDTLVKGAAMTLVGEAGNRVANASPAQVCAPLAASISLVADDAMRTQTGSSSAWSVHCTLGEQGVKDDRLVALPWGENEGHGLASALGSQVDFGRETTTTAPESFGLWAPPFAPAACWCARMTVPST